jgi:uncharacterized protein (TIGR02266 family)
MDSDRRSQRYPSHEPLQLRCETWREFVDTYANDMCRGGMFIRTDDAREALSDVELRLILPEGTEIALSARVVHVVTPEQAEQYRQTAGMGVEFIHGDAEQKRQILQLVEFARNQGDNADPNSSWNRTLLENSAPLPTRDVAARLSMLPAAAAPNTSRSRTNMPAVQAGVPANDGSSPKHGAVRPRGQSVQLDPSVMAAAARAPSAPVQGATGATGPVTGVTKRSSAFNPAVRAPTGPLTGATSRSSTNIPIVRTPTMPVAGASSRSSTKIPIVRTPTVPMSGASSRSGTNTPNARTPTGPVTSPSQPGGRTASGPISGQPSGDPASNPENGQPQAPPQPTDLNRLKLVLNSLAHKHYEDAARLAREMLVDNPGDPQVLKWQAICFARIAITRNDPAGACEHYTKALTYDENNREARDYVRTFQRDQKLNALPFGRYFLKKK